ncbi:transcriptional regulator with PAS, ATPase and Fis domain [Bacillus tianshenii]|uniref:Transcriptional regulator with PAS, ATPase and Fis domain n=1 Tax=Sutcliffiella tianshenii TaxID=1463404 RepID=A0ABS2P360_9BACI|nr:sigma 54-interacting transcriptional regulator [Bacillus tianshenii]MBM7621402.1 transcriptional regulator with PAS, ATPase and Fis domain [Bacillus tianshenii]MCA1319957.1 sigma 54-interacting transcriptional regulator [Bacillus tianshenii]
MGVKDSLLTDEMMDTIIANAFEWIVVVDHRGDIIYLNDSYSAFLDVDSKTVIGKHVTEVIENTRMHHVVQTGKEELADLQYIRGNYMIANRVPIFNRNKEVIGAYGTVIFRDTSEWDKMNSHVKSMLGRIRNYLQEYEQQTGVKYTLEDIIGKSKLIQTLKEKVKHIASSDVSVLIRGESGTGKELFAHSIHQLSNRSSMPFIKLNCAAIPEHLLESELFGYEEGAFTGAKKGGKKGKFLLADGGTLFLDEIGDMSLPMQIKLLRALQEGEVEPIGAGKPIQVNVRVIAATNRPLEKMMEEKRFRDDLYYRIHVIPFHIPSLRERTEDIPMLVEHFIQKICKRTGRRITSVTPDALAVLSRYRWPGNIRELENVIQAAVHLSTGDKLTLEALPDYLTESYSIPFGSKSLKDTLEEAEKQAIIQTLENVNDDKLEAAKLLGISKSSLYEKIKKYHIG